MKHNRRVNKYPTTCTYCGGRVAKNAGYVWKHAGRWVGTHLACDTSGAPEVSTIVIGDNTYTRNSRGRCEDAPCCGCCTI